jgi:hypothetical protein
MLSAWQKADTNCSCDKKGVLIVVYMQQVFTITSIVYSLPNYSRDYLQATGVSVEDSVGYLTTTAVYLPPKQTVCKTQLEDFYNTLGPRFIAGGDYNAKHTD